MDLRVNNYFYILNYINNNLLLDNKIIIFIMNTLSVIKQIEKRGVTSRTQAASA